MGYFSDAYKDFKWFEKMRKEANVGKRDFKQIDKIHRRNKMKKESEENDMYNIIEHLFLETGFPAWLILSLGIIAIFIDYWEDLTK